MSQVQMVTPDELRDRIAAREELVLLDVREPREWRIARVEGSLLIPLGELAGRAHELDPARPTVCICHHGIRSHAAALSLVRLGFAQVYNLAGGLDRWALDVDSGMRRY